MGAVNWRVGRSLGRTLYRDEALVGLVDTAEIAKDIIDAMNALDERRGRSDEIVRLGSLLDDAVHLLMTWAEPGPRPPFLASDTRRFLDMPEIAKIAQALADAGWKTAPLVCPSCGVDYAEAEAKNARLAKAAKPADSGDDWREFYTASDEVHDGSRRTQFAELEVVRLKEEHAVYAPAMVNLLDAGAVGTIVHVHQPLDPKPAYEVEFTDDAGKTIAVLTLRDDEIEKMT